MRQAFPAAHLDSKLCPGLQRELRSYFTGKPTRFNQPYRLENLTDFQQQVLDACSRIPAGRTMSYAELAAWIGRPNAARAVGNALGRNPLPILIPCHRVVANNQRLGGFSAQAGTELKRKLLALEGVQI